MIYRGCARVLLSRLGLRSLGALWLAIAPTTACDGGPVAPLEIGVKAADGTFHPWAEGESVRVLLTPSGSHGMIAPSLRATGIDPRAPDPEVEVIVDGFTLAADIAGARVDMMDDGIGYVLWDLQVPFQTELCCYVCSEGTVVARIRDRADRAFEGRVTVRFELRGGCPDVEACCVTADACPDPALAHLCM